ncbi:hypothetical protein [Nocardia puris]|uniref:hypothetical protein n=1 Tax=Nocardia puris TaxID=208602 RepID=UPI001E57DB86|nr:hypothetical protein [Nocardia puris]
MMDFVHADPAGNVLWGGDSGGLWKMVALETVVADIISGSNSAPTSSSSPGPTRCPPASPASSVRSSIESDSGGNTIREALAPGGTRPEPMTHLRIPPKENDRTTGRIVLLGTTDYPGGLVLDALLRRDGKPVVAGRNREASGARPVRAFQLHRRAGRRRIRCALHRFHG